MSRSKERLKGEFAAVKKGRCASSERVGVHPRKILKRLLGIRRGSRAKWGVTKH